MQPHEHWREAGNLIIKLTTLKTIITLRSSSRRTFKLIPANHTTHDNNGKTAAPRSENRRCHSTLSWGDWITVTSLFDTISVLVQLQPLNLKGCKAITDAVLTSIATLVQLQHLNLSCCWGITDAGFAIIAPWCRFSIWTSRAARGSLTLA